MASPTDWVYVSRIDAVPAMFSHVPVDGPCEPAIVQLQDGRILTIFRIESFHSHWGAMSSDGGKSWGEPFETGTWAVAPNLFQMKSGAIVLTSGRPAIGLWVADSADVSMWGKWQFHNIMKVHNAAVMNPAHQYPAVDAAVENVSSPHYPVGYNNAGRDASTAYTGLSSLDDDTLLLSYDRLANGWAGPPGPLGDSDMVFTMTVKIS